MNFYQECTAKTYSFLFIDPTLASDNLLHFGKNFRNNRKTYHENF